jgi:hypothetical protein
MGFFGRASDVARRVPGVSIIFAAHQPYSACPFACSIYDLMFYVGAQIVRQKKRYGTALMIDNRAWISTRVARISPQGLNR